MSTSTSANVLQLPTGNEIRLGVRQGGIERGGTYFSTAGSSSYFDPTRHGVELYDLAGAHLADTSNALTTVALLEEMLRAVRFPFKQRGRIEVALKQASKGDPFIDYPFAEELPLKEAGNHLGFDGVLVWGNDDITGPSSAFIWQAQRVRALTPEESEAVLLYYASEAFGACGAADLVRDRASYASPSPRA